MKAIDVSIYSGEIPVEKWRAVKVEGYELAIIGLFHGRTANHYAAQQMRAAHEAGMLLAGYVLIAPWTGMTGGGQVETGLEVAAPELIPQLRFLAVDMEVDGATEVMAWDAISRVGISEGLRPLIYTGRWWWVYHFKDSKEFKDIPLWAAQYPFFMPDEPENLLEWVKLYGGWTQFVGWQYTDTTQFHGINCCKDWFDDAWIRDLKEEPMVDWPKEKLRLLNDFLLWWDQFPETQEEKDDLGRQHDEDEFYREFFSEQIAWRSPPR